MSLPVPPSHPLRTLCTGYVWAQAHAHAHRDSFPDNGTHDNHRSHLPRAPCVPRPVLNPSHLLTLESLRTSRGGKYYHFPYFTGGKTGAQSRSWRLGRSPVLTAARLCLGNIRSAASAGGTMNNSAWQEHRAGATETAGRGRGPHRCGSLVRDEAACP